MRKNSLNEKTQKISQEHYVSRTEALSVVNDRPPTAKALIDLAIKHCDLFHDERGDGYVVLKYEGVQRTLKLNSKAFRRWLAGTLYTTTGRVANNEALSTTLSILEAKAIFGGYQLSLSNRFAKLGDNIFIDLADTRWRVIKVTVDGWEVLDKPPVMFRRYTYQQALPEPVRGGKLSDIHNYLAVKSDDDKYLLEAWLVACAFSNIPRPVITFHGPQGASKTTTARCIKALSDPSLTESIDLGRAPSELAQILDHHGVPCFDNLTNIQPWAADMLCRAVTGGAFSKRELYSDDSDVIMTFKRPMIITGINIPTHAPDLLDRLLLIELERIQSDRRVDEATFWARFNANKAILFGALLDSIAGALLYLPNIRLDVMPRMADFTCVACAYAEFAGIGHERMLKIIMRHTSRQLQEILDADPLAASICSFIRREGSWTGTAAKLLELLNETAPIPRPGNWPRQANNLSRKLNILHATLNEAGISIRKQKLGPNRERLLVLEITAESSSVSSSSFSSGICEEFV